MAKRYKVKEIYYTLQGEGFHTGRAAVFCRFTGCNLWNGKEEDRPSAVCSFCDTDFIGTDGENGGRYEAAELVQLIRSLWPLEEKECFVVFTGGEPGLQMDEALLTELHRQDCTVAIETNGTVPLPAGIDWVCVSPKAGSDIILRSGDELKLVYPQAGMMPEHCSSWDFQHFYLQPMDSEAVEDYTRQAIAYIRRNPKWRLSIQTHKILGIQ